MWLSKANSEEKTRAPEKIRYSRYYEHDGALRAYANRAMVFSLISLPTTLLAVALATFVRLQPPTVIRVDSSGAAALGTKSEPTKPLFAIQETNSEATEFERKAYARLFLERFLNFSPEAVSWTWADALNMMTTNLRRSTLNAIETQKVVEKIQEDQITSVFRLRSLEHGKDDPFSFTAYGIKEVHRVRDHREDTDKLVGEFHIRLITERRSEQNPSGLLVAEYEERLIEGERKDATARPASLSNSN